MPDAGEREWTTTAAAAQALPASGAAVAVMVQLGVSLADALARMRAYAYAKNQQLGEVATDIMAQRLRFDPNPDQHGPHTGQGQAGRQS